MTWLWIPITVGAALAQTLRNAAQRHLTGDLGPLGATLVRFLYGLPFAAAWLAVLCVAIEVHGDAHLVAPAFFLWTLLGSLAQIAATAFLLRAMAERNFALGVAYAKTEVLQVALYAAVLLGDPVTVPAVIAILLASGGVILLSLPQGDRSLKAFLLGWTSRAALFGLASGAAFAVSATGYRGAALATQAAPVAFAAAYTLLWAQVLQTVLLGGWLLWRRRQVITAVLRAWRVSLFAGAMGAVASACWFTAMAMEPVAHVRTLGLIELLFSYVVSRRVFRERLTGAELSGLVLLALGLIAIISWS